MGFTWSLWIAQRINEAVALQSCPSLEGRLLHDRQPPLVLHTPGSCGSTALDGARDKAAEGSHLYVHVNNLGVIGTCSRLVGEQLEKLETGFNRRGLLLHKSEISSQRVTTLGVNLDGSLLKTRATDKR